MAEGDLQVGPPFEIVSTCKGGGYKYARTNPPHPRANAKGLYPLHRVLAENRLGRLLRPGEVVHHKDHDKTNDEPENLEPKTNAEHSREHMVEIRGVPSVDLTCDHCGAAFSLKPAAMRLRRSRNKGGLVFCSRSCGAQHSDNLHLDRGRDTGTMSAAV